MVLKHLLVSHRSVVEMYQQVVWHTLSTLFLHSWCYLEFLQELLAMPHVSANFTWLEAQLYLLQFQAGILHRTIVCVLICCLLQASALVMCQWHQLLPHLFQFLKHLSNICLLVTTLWQQPLSSLYQNISRSNILHFIWVVWSSLILLIYLFILILGSSFDFTTTQWALFVPGFQNNQLPSSSGWLNWSRWMHR